jgi:reactive intermediate/imine deaminase
MPRLALSVAALAFAFTAQAQAAVYTPMGGSTPRPFSAAVTVNGFIYLSGQLGTDSTGKVVTGGITAETHQAMENIKALLKAQGATMDDVVKCTVFLADMAEWPAMNTVYATFFTKHFPARSAFGTTGLALGARVEIECLAQKHAP